MFLYALVNILSDAHFSQTDLSILEKWAQQSKPLAFNLIPAG